MDGLMLLDEARAVGLKVAAEGGCLRIQGPRRAEALAQWLLVHKVAVLAALALEAPITVTPDDLPADWHLAWDERAAIMENDGKLPRERAEALALLDVIRQMRVAGGPRRRAMAMPDRAPGRQEPMNPAAEIDGGSLSWDN
jgi:hypothetical protein